MQFLTKEEEKLVVQSIKDAELGTSAEVKVHIDKTCKADPLDSAVKWFYKLKMEQTELRNGVLVYIAYKDRKMAIIGDKGINELVDETYWDETYALMKAEFAKGNACRGLCSAIDSIGKKLQQFFPYQSDDVNELSDDISYGK